MQRIGVERIERQPHAERGRAIEECLFKAKNLAMDVDAADVGAEPVVDAVVDIVEVVVAKEDAVGGPGAFVVGDLEAAAGGNGTERPGRGRVLAGQ